MFPILQIVLLLGFTFNEPKAIAQDIPYKQVWFNQVAPVNKHTDAAKPLYSVRFMTSPGQEDYRFEKFVIDIEAPFPWLDCVVDWNYYDYEDSCNSCRYPVSCKAYQCTDVQTTYAYQSHPSCHPVVNSGSTSPGSQQCSCPVNVVSPVDGTCSQAMLNCDLFSLNSSDGRNPYRSTTNINSNAGCAPSSTFDSFPANVRGVMAFSRSPYAKPALEWYLSTPNDILALCLPSNLSSTGVMFFGDGPYYLLPNSTVDVKSLLSYTPLLKHPDSFGYFIDVKALVIKGRSINVSSAGNSTTKLSTTEPYTTLRVSDQIYITVLFGDFQRSPNESLLQSQLPHLASATTSP